jgi:hypothetical protein
MAAFGYYIETAVGDNPGRIHYCELGDTEPLCGMTDVTGDVLEAVDPPSPTEAPPAVSCRECLIQSEYVG